MAGAGVTTDDLRALGTDIKDYIGERVQAVEAHQVERFEAVNQRLDKLNGAVARHEVRLAEEAQKVKGLEQEIFIRPSREAQIRAAQPIAAAGDEARPALTRGDLKRMTAAAAFITVVVEALHKLGAVLQSMVQAGAK